MFMMFMYWTQSTEVLEDIFRESDYFWRLFLTLFITSDICKLLQHTSPQPSASRRGYRLHSGPDSFLRLWTVHLVTLQLFQSSLDHYSYCWLLFRKGALNTLFSNRALGAASTMKCARTVVLLGQWPCHSAYGPLRWDHRSTPAFLAEQMKPSGVRYIRGNSSLFGSHLNIGYFVSNHFSQAHIWWSWEPSTREADQIKWLGWHCVFMHADWRTLGLSTCMCCHWDLCRSWAWQLPCQGGHLDVQTASFLTMQVWRIRTWWTPSTGLQDFHSSFVPLDWRASGRSNSHPMTSS